MRSKRRAVLRGVGTAMLGIGVGAGCSTLQSRNDPTATTAAEEPTSIAATTEASGQFGVDATLTTGRYLVRGWQPAPGRFPAADAVPVADLPTAARQAISIAIRDGIYETAQPQHALLAAVDGLRLVTRNGTVYTLTHTFTEYVLNWRPLPDADSDTLPADRVVDRHSDTVQESEAVAEAVNVVTPHGTQNGSGEYRTLVLAPELESFLDRYDFVRSDVGVGRLEFHVVRQYPPFTLRATEATDEQRYGREVVPAATFSPDGRTVLRAAVEQSPRTPVDPEDRQPWASRQSVPVLLADRLDDGAYVRLDGTIYHVRVDHRHWNRQPFTLGLSVPKESVSAGDPARVELSATNRGSVSAVLTIPGLLPFGLLWARRVDDPRRAVQLWSHRFEGAETVRIEDGVAKPDSYQRDLMIAPDETVTRTYQFGRDTEPIAPGTYRVPAGLWVEWPPKPNAERYDWISRVYPYEIMLRVAEPDGAI